MNFKQGLSLKKQALLRRWLAPDFPGGTERFQINLLAKDILIFLVLPLAAILAYRSASGVSIQSLRSRTSQVESSVSDLNISTQIIRFAPLVASNVATAMKRSPGTLVRLRLLNSVESFDGASAHAQIVDGALGARFVGGVIVGDVQPDTSTARIGITFRFVRDPKNRGQAFPVAARAMSLDGTTGLNANKKEGFFARAAIRSGTGANSNSDSGSQDLRSMVARAIAAGMMQEFQEEATVANKKAQVLVLQPGIEFFAELTDFFPASSR